MKEEEEKEGKKGEKEEGEEEDKERGESKPEGKGAEGGRAEMLREGMESSALSKTWSTETSNTRPNTPNQQTNTSPCHGPVREHNTFWNEPDWNGIGGKEMAS